MNEINRLMGATPEDALSLLPDILGVWVRETHALDAASRGGPRAGGVVCGDGRGWVWRVTTGAAQSRLRRPRAGTYTRTHPDQKGIGKHLRGCGAVRPTCWT